MRIFGKFALATALATATVTMAAMPVAAEAKSAQPSAQFVALYNNVAAQLNAGEIAAAKTTFEQMAAGITNDKERYLAGKLAIQVAQRANPEDSALMEQGANLILSSKETPKEELAPAAISAAFAAYNQKNYASAISFADKAKELGSTAPRVDFVAGLSKLAQQQMGGFDQLRAAVKANASAPEQWYELPTRYALNWKAGADATVSAKLNEEIAYWTRAQLEAYPSGTSWRNALGAYQNSLSGVSRETLEDIYRLRAYTGGLTDAADYEGYLSSITRSGYVMNPNEALRWLNEGIEKGYITGSEPFIVQGLNSARTGKAADAKDSAKLEADALSSKSQLALIASADRALDQGRYARAIELYDIAASAGADADVVALRKGIANYELGNVAGARANFEQVSTAPSTGLAAYWMLYLDQNSGQ